MIKQNLLALSLFVALNGSTQASAQTKQILVGPNVLVSRESAYPNVELMLAANPKNPKNLVGAAIVTTPVGDRCVAYTSMDGGSTWRIVEFPQLPESGTGDPQVVFGMDGTAYFTALGQVANEKGERHMVLELFRSSDGGLSWEQAGVYGFGYGDDHPQMAADPRPDHAGTIYTTCLCHFGKEEWTIGLFRTTDRGGHTAAPVKVASAPPGMGVFDLNPLVLSDGVLFIPFQVFEPKRLEERTSPTFDTYFTTSVDGGSTFSTSAKIRTQVLDPKANVPSPYGGVFFAADTHSEQFLDRIYMLATEAISGRYMIRLSYSKDRGKTWSEPKQVAPLPPGDAAEYQPTISINHQGVAGISWWDTRDSAHNYREYFTASLDGGDSFLPAVPISSEPSPIDASGNDVASHTIDSPTANSRGEVEFSMVTSRGFSIAGEYMGSVADSNGAFHLFWSDARSGFFQVWTAAAKIPSSANAASGTQAAQEKDASSAHALPVPLAGKLLPIFDPAKYDRQTGVEEIPIRLKNFSANTICSPIVVQLNGPNSEGKDDAAASAAQDDAARGPQVLNANNGKRWSGATFDYSSALGDFSCLDPEAITSAVLWRLKVPNLANPFASFTLTITGVTR